MSTPPAATTDPTKLSSPTSTTSPASPSFPRDGNLTLRGIDVENTPYHLSSERTSPTELPFPHPKWHVRPSSKEIYETISPIFEEYDPVTGFLGSVGPIRESIESEPDKRKRRQDSDESARTWKGYVVWPESVERTSIKREADWGRNGGEEKEAKEASMSKKLKEEH